MRQWSLSKGDPFTLSLAADGRFGDGDYTNDQIWQISWGNTEPPGLNLQTTFGLRARWMRLFPWFTTPQGSLSDPEQFFQPPRLTAFAPNYLSLNFSPFSGLEVQAEYWVPASQVITGRLHLINHSVLTQPLRLDWVSLLSPMGEGQSMTPIQMGLAHVLQGKSGSLYPVCFMTGSPQPGPSVYPSLSIDLELFPGNQYQYTWALATLDNAAESLNLARMITSRPWDAEITRMELFNDSQLLDIETGNPDWDAAFAFSQKTASGLFFPSTHHLPHSSFVLSRQPDQGCSLRGDGSDYPPLWNGQTVLESWYMTSLLLPGNVDLAKGIVDNFLFVQDERGFIDWKPGLGGQRSRRLAQPLLATLALQIEGYVEDQKWLWSIYPGLLRFLRSWFSPQHDRDEDGFPEWDHPLQTGIDSIPLYNRWQTTSEGVEITTLECPGLAAMLVMECQSLLQIARKLGDQEPQAWLKARIDALKKALSSTWDDQIYSYHYRDQQTHTSPAGQTLLSFQGPGKFSLHQTFKPAQRLQIHLVCKDERTRPLTLIIQGEGSRGKITEEINSIKFSWSQGYARATTSNVFKKLIQVEVRGISAGDKGRIIVPDYRQEDISLLLPLWAGIPSTQRAKELVEKNLLKRYLQPHGLSTFPTGAPNLEANSILLPWNQFLGEGLLRYGYVQQAANLVSRLMDGIIKTLKSGQAFREVYPPGEGHPGGEINPLNGLAPIGLFLKTLGIQKIQKDFLIVQGFNPYPWPVTVKYVGMVLICHSDHMVVQFSSGQTISVSGQGPHRVFLS